MSHESLPPPPSPATCRIIARRQQRRRRRRCRRSHLARANAPPLNRFPTVSSCSSLRPADVSTRRHLKQIGERSHAIARTSLICSAIIVGWRKLRVRQIRGASAHSRRRRRRRRFEPFNEKNSSVSERAGERAKAWRLCSRSAVVVVTRAAANAPMQLSSAHVCARSYSACASFLFSSRRLSSRASITRECARALARSFCSLAGFVCRLVFCAFFERHFFLRSALIASIAFLAATAVAFESPH